MKVAVLLPSRARPDRLHKTIKSTYDTATEFEILVRLDDDDKLTLDRLKEFDQYDKVKFVIGPRERGYGSLNIFYTELANSSDAEWISIMNDDAVYEGKDWDKQLFGIPTEGFIVQPELYQLGGSKYFNCEGGAFPFVPNSSWKKYGPAIMPDPVDTCLDNILRKESGWKTQFLKGIGVVHDREDQEILDVHRLIN
jgi:GT2 family glycosyltransferase